MDLVEVPGGPSINGARLRVGEQLGINGGHGKPLTNTADNNDQP
jgi:hypothetical protein